MNDALATSCMHVLSIGALVRSDWPMPVFALVVGYQCIMLQTRCAPWYAVLLAEREWTNLRCYSSKRSMSRIRRDALVASIWVQQCYLRINSVHTQTLLFRQLCFSPPTRPCPFFSLPPSLVFFSPTLKMVLLELTDFLWFLSGLLQMSPGVFFEKLDRGVDKFGGAVFGIPNWGSRRYVCIHVCM